MIGVPFDNNDLSCLGTITEVIADLVARRDPLLAELAATYPTTEALAAWIRSLPQRDDEGIPGDGPKVDACEPPQRLRIPAPDPNCVERAALYLGVAELIDPWPVRQLATLDFDWGRHTFPIEAGAPVVLDPRVSSEEMGRAMARNGWNMQGAPCTSAAPAAPAPVAIDVTEALQYTAQLAESGAQAVRNGPSRARLARNAIRSLVETGRPPSDPDTVDAMGWFFAQAEKVARSYGARALAIVRTTAQAIADLVDDVLARLAGSRWLVPSQTDASGGYVVDAEQNSCTCPDHEDRGVKCKHIWAVAYLRTEVTLPDGTTIVTEKRVTYSQPDWSAYHRAQCDEKHRVQLLLRGLCDGIAQPEQAGGRPRLRLADVVYGATMKVFSTMSGRRADTDIRECEGKGLLAKAPSYNSLFRYLERPEMAPLLKALVHEAAAPLRAVETAFAIDSTGFATNTYARWFDEKYGQEKKCQRWIKLHAQVGTATHVIASVEATESTVGDAPMLAPLLASSVERGFDVRELSADKAYLSNENLVAIEAAHAVPYIPFKSNSRGTGKTDAWRRLWHMFEAQNDQFLAHYHKRSNVESAFSSVKRKFGASVRSKALPAQINEALLKCLCHNLSALVHAIHELKIDPAFWTRMEVA